MMKYITKVDVGADNTFASGSLNVKYNQLEKQQIVMLSLIDQIIARLEEINDGSFVVEDFLSAQLKGKQQL